MLIGVVAEGRTIRERDVTGLRKRLGKVGLDSEMPLEKSELATACKRAPALGANSASGISSMGQCQGAKGSKTYGEAAKAIKVGPGGVVLRGLAVEAGHLPNKGAGEGVGLLLAGRGGNGGRHGKVGVEGGSCFIVAAEGMKKERENEMNKDKKSPRRGFVRTRRV